MRLCPDLPITHLRGAALELPEALLPVVEPPAKLPRGIGPLVELLRVLLKFQCEEHHVAQRLRTTGVAPPALLKPTGELAFRRPPSAGVRPGRALVWIARACDSASLSGRHPVTRSTSKDERRKPRTSGASPSIRARWSGAKGLIA